MCLPHSVWSENLPTCVLASVWPLSASQLVFILLQSLDFPTRLSWSSFFSRALQNPKLVEVSLPLPSPGLQLDHYVQPCAGLSDIKAHTSQLKSYNGPRGLLESHSPSAWGHHHGSTQEEHRGDLLYPGRFQLRPGRTYSLHPGKTYFFHVERTHLPRTQLRGLSWAS